MCALFSVIAKCSAAFFRTAPILSIAVLPSSSSGKLVTTETLLSPVQTNQTLSAPVAKVNGMNFFLAPSIISSVTSGTFQCEIVTDSIFHSHSLEFRMFNLL